jgi:hypothetical protein
MRAPGTRAVARVCVTAILAMLCGCGGAPPQAPAPRYASAEQIETAFRGRGFILGDDNTVAKLSPLDGKDRVFRLPFWLGVNILVPGVLQPTQGDYYVISGAELVRRLDSPDEWLIEAGSTLIKKETVLVNTRTHFRSTGTMLPMIVQFMGMRAFRRGDGSEADLPVLREVSLPMKWTLGGPIPRHYARFEAR